jgi:hypothetical protein
VKTVLKVMVMRIVMMMKLLKRQKKKRWEGKKQVIVKVALKEVVALRTLKMSHLVVSVNIV